MNDSSLQSDTWLRPGFITAGRHPWAGWQALASPTNMAAAAFASSRIRWSILNVEALLPRLIKARGFADADDIASVIHHRLAHVTTRPAGSGRTRQAPRLIAGLIPEATGPMTPDMQQALTERRQLIETRAEAVLDTALHTHEPWVTALGPMPASGRERQQWRRRAVVVAAYRDRYQITDPTPLGPQPESTAQKIDRARAETALRTLTRQTIEDQRRRPAAQATRHLDL